MLFAQSRDSDTAFTMARVRTPLKITWYSGDGQSVGSTSMRPCRRDTAHCPVYASNRPYRFALETPGGVQAPAQLGPCG
jgi:uncharacterized membrane protein (UPF0127 family)